MISIHSGSYRKDNLTITLSNLYATVLQEKNQAFSLLDFRTLPVSFLYENQIFGEASDEVNNLLKTHIIEPKKFIFITPEYNGSFPGIVKAFIDICDPKWFKGKKAALAGISAGRAGNLRGMDHLASVLGHLDVQVLPMKLPVSRINDLMNDEKKIIDDQTIKVVNEHVERILNF